MGVGVGWGGVLYLAKARSLYGRVGIWAGEGGSAWGEGCVMGWVGVGVGWCAVQRVRAGVGAEEGVSVGNGVSCRGSRESRHLNKTAPG